MSVYDTHKPAAGEGGGLYLKIKDGETAKLRIASEPAIFEAQGEREGKTTLSTKYGWVVWNQEAKAAQILQQSATFFKSIAALAQDEEWGDPQGYDIKVSRQGSGFNDTTYTVMPSANREALDEQTKDAIEKIDLLGMLKKSPFAQRVMWLSVFDKQAAESEENAHDEEIAALETAGKAKKADEAPKKPAPKDDVVIEDIGDEPMNLDDIPF